MRGLPGVAKKLRQRPAQKTTLFTVEGRVIKLGFSGSGLINSIYIR